MISNLNRPSDNSIQSDESYFAERRKCNRSWLDCGDKKPPVKEASRVILEIELTCWSSETSQPEHSEYEELCERPWYEKNYEKPGIGPWVVEMYLWLDEVWFFIVSDRTGNTLRKPIRDNSEVGSSIVTDEWLSYKRIVEDGFI